jgi:hypothetical protein
VFGGAMVLAGFAPFAVALVLTWFAVPRKRTD